MKVPNTNPDHSENKTHRSGEQSRESIRRMTTRITDFFGKKESEKEEKNGIASKKTKEERPTMKAYELQQQQQQENKKGNKKTTNESKEEDWWGDEMERKQEGTLRIYHQNVNGMKYDRLGGDMGWYAHYMVDQQIDIMGISEHNVDNCSPKVITTALEAIRRISREIDMNMGGTKSKTETPYKPGGTLSLVQGNMRGRVTDKGKDSMGRWVYERLRGKKGKSVFVITVYQACKSNPTANLTAAAQQLSALKQAGDNATPREAFKRDLSKFIKQMMGPKDDAIVIGDFNEAIDDESGGIVRLMEDTGTVDLMTAVHDKELPTTFDRGTSCIDYALATPRIANAVKRAGYTPTAGGLQSDHRGLYIDIDINEALGGTLSQLPTQTNRSFNASSPAMVSKYLDEATRKLESRNVSARVERLVNMDRPDHEMAESIDRDITRMLLSAASKLKKYKPPPWIEELHHTRRQLRVWKGHLKALRKNKTPPKSLESLYNSIPEGKRLPTTTTECKQLLRQARRRIDHIVANAARHRQEELERRAQEHAKSTAPDGKAKASIIRNIRKREEIREMFKKLQRVRNKTTDTSITTVKVPLDPNVDPKQCTEWTEVDTPEEVETAI